MHFVYCSSPVATIFLYVMSTDSASSQQRKPKITKQESSSNDESYKDGIKQKLIQKQKELKTLQTKYDSLNDLYRALEINHNEQSKIHKQHIEALKAENKKLSEKQMTYDQTLKSAMNRLKELQAKYDEMKPDYDRLKAMESEYNGYWIKLDKIHSKNEQKINALKQENEALSQQIIELKTIKKNMVEPSSEKHKAALLQIAQLKSQKSLASSNEEMNDDDDDDESGLQAKYEKLLSENAKLKQCSSTSENKMFKLFEVKCAKQRNDYKQQIDDMKEKYVEFLLEFKRLKEKNQELMAENEALYQIKRQTKRFL